MQGTIEEGSPQSQADPASESNQLLGRFANGATAQSTAELVNQAFVRSRFSDEKRQP
jgi:hypothetical protein